MAKDAGSSPYDQDLEKTKANYVPLTPLSFLRRAAKVYPEHPAVVYGDTRRSWGETYDRCRRLASALDRRGVGRGDTVAIVAANIPEMFEAHFGVPMAGAVLNTINIRLEARDIAYILNHGEAKVVLVDPEFAETVREAAANSDVDPLIVDIPDPNAGEARAGELTYDELLKEGDPDADWAMPGDEWEAISLNYTSGTTGDPKGVVYHHRGAYLNALAHVPTWGMEQHCVYLWTLPMFHCNGWCFPWTLAALAGTNVCLRAVRAKPIFDLIRKEKVTHFCGAPIVLNTLANASDEEKGGGIHDGIKAMTAGAAPPARVMQDMEAMGVRVTHVYGLTETYGPATICAWKKEWSDLDQEEQNRMKVRQGVENTALEAVTVLDPETLEPVPQDGETIGEVFFRGNNVMKGYLKMPDKTEEDFRGGWFASGDLGVMHPNNYIEIKDRSKDIIISGGENISSLEIEDVLYKHPAVNTAAVVAKPDDKWGETPCAFVELKQGREATADEIIAFCRKNMAKFKAPKDVVFGELPKTSTGKIQKYVLRERAKEMAAG